MLSQNFKIISENFDFDSDFLMHIMKNKIQTLALGSGIFFSSSDFKESRNTQVVMPLC